MSRPRRSAKKREQLLTEGIGLLARRGYHATGVKEILDGVGIPKGSFYNYFDSKETFAAEVIDHYCRRTESALRALVDLSLAQPLAGLRRILDTLAMAYGPNGAGCLVGNMIGEVAEAHSELRQHLLRGIESWRVQFARLIAAGQQAGEIRNDLEAGELAGFLWTAWQGALAERTLTHSDDPLTRCRTLVLSDLFAPRRPQ